jgi:large subunit ribosomal protein L28
MEYSQCDEFHPPISLRPHSLKDMMDDGLLIWRLTMGRKCQLTGKTANNAFAISHSHRRTKKVQEANLQWKRIWWPQGNRWVRLRLSTKAIKTLDKLGLQAMAKQAGLDLNRL